ncbi:protein translocase subunit SecD [Deinococcus roseus]|uniref:Multifunctional fusion protein n=1 Tax=Deinococcus roseus TaxID=392414 RepID=A0ABQ2CTX6_9DEIO|nr:protein translocase subunit SecD [Deinococcus roseus]GGJ20330.1 protein translocase subunit SecDF [Deinococcus roseus]
MHQAPRKKRRAQAPGANTIWTTLVILAVLVGSLLSIWRPWQHPQTPTALWTENFKFLNLGLDLQGGLRVTMKVDTANPTADDVDKAKTILENRVNALGIAEPTVQRQGNDRVVIELPGIKPEEQDKARKLIGTTAKLTFHIVPDAIAQKTDAEMKVSELGPAVATGDIILNAQAQADSGGRWAVSFTTTPEGSKKLETLTRANVGKRMAIVLDNQIKSAPTLQSVLSTNGQITGSFTSEEATDLALVLKSGALPVPLKEVEVRAIGPSLGADAIKSGAIASLVGIGLVFVFAFYYYGLYFGLVIAVGLLFSGLIIMGILGGLGATLTLPGIAGLVLTIGAAVDGNVISFERIKEELRRGKGIRGAVNNGFNHSFWTIFDVNLSHLLSAFALANYSTGAVKGFAVTLAVGVIASAFSNLVFSKWMMTAMAQRRQFTAPDWAAFKHPTIDFMKPAAMITTASVALAIIGTVIVGVKGFNLGVDFTAGTSYTVATKASVEVEDVRSKLETADIQGVDPKAAVIQRSVTPGIEGAQFTVKVGEIADTTSDQLRKTLTELDGGQVTQIEKVGPTVGKELTDKTLKAVILGLFLILVYVAFRFDVIFGVGSVLAVIHDVGIVMGLYSLLGLEFTISTVAAILTLIGYSLNDSIIVSDRMRENLKLMRGKPFREIVNASINQTLSRTIMTSVTTMLPLVSLFFLGGSVLRDFSLILLVGIIIGTYSSIYIVAPMVVFYNNWRATHKPNSKKPAKA